MSLWKLLSSGITIIKYSQTSCKPYQRVLYCDKRMTKVYWRHSRQRSATSEDVDDDGTSKKTDTSMPKGSSNGVSNKSIMSIFKRLPSMRSTSTTPRAGRSFVLPKTDSDREILLRNIVSIESGPGNTTTCLCFTLKDGDKFHFEMEDVSVLYLFPYLH